MCISHFYHHKAHRWLMYGHSRGTMRVSGDLMPSRS